MRCKHYEANQCDCNAGVCYSFKAIEELEAEKIELNQFLSTFDKVKRMRQRSKEIAPSAYPNK